MEQIDLAEYVSHLSKYEVLLCRVCKHCVKPSEDAIKRHFMHKRHRKIPLKIRQEIVKYGTELKLMNPEKVRNSSSEIEPIEGLKLMTR